MDTNETTNPIQIEVDELIHTNERPFCSDMSCPCHDDEILIEEYIGNPLHHGWINKFDALMLFNGL